MQQPVSPTEQSIELVLHPERPDYTGTVRVELQVRKAVSTFQFHALDIELGEAVLSGSDNSFPLTLTSDEKGLVTATAANEIPAGGYTLTIDFGNEFGTQAVGLYRMEQDGSHYLFTQMETSDARRAFPCWDEPIFKIPYQMTLIVPMGMEAVTNTPLETKVEKEGWWKLSFAKSKPTSSYLLALASGPFESVPISGLSVPGRIYAPRGQIGLAQLAVEKTPPLLAALEDYFGRPYPYQKLDFVAVPEYWPGAMENPGLITFADQILLIDTTQSSFAQRRFLAEVIGHELAHMWFGDLVTMRWWDDLWLNESFASWMGDKITHQVYPDYRVDVANMPRVESILARDARPSTKPIRRKVVTSSDALEDLGVAYWKGQAVLGMFEHWVGEEDFRKGVLDYIEAHAWGNARGEDLWNAVTESSGKNLRGTLPTFLDQSGYPLVSLEPAGSGYKLSQTRFLNHGVSAPNSVWKIPLRIKYGDGTRIQTRELLLDSAEMTMDLGDQVAWILPDEGGSGYFRWQVPTEMLLDLAKSARQVLAPRERMAFLGNASALLSAGILRGDEYLQVLNAFADDPDPLVISQLISALDSIQLPLVPDKMRPAFARYVRHTLGPARERFSLKPQFGEDEAVALFRPALLRKLGLEGLDPEARTFASDLARTYLEGSGDVDPATISTALQVAANTGDRELFDRYRKAYEEARTPARRLRFLSALAAFPDTEIQKSALQYSLGDSVRPTDLFRVAGGLPSTTAGRDLAWRWLTENYESITSHIPPEFVPQTANLAGGCSKERLEEAKDFFADPKRNVEGTQAQLAKVSEQVQDCLNLRAREGGAVAAYLDRLEEGD